MSSDAVLMPSRILRGAATAGVRGAVMGADLSLLAPPPRDVAETITEDPAEVARATREDAARRGYEDGYQTGRQDALLAAQTQAIATAEAAATALHALDGATATLRESQTATVAEVEQHIVDMALAIATAVIQRELTAATEPGREALLRALALAPERIAAVARIHPDDLATIGDLTSLTAEREITLIADAAVERGGCVLDVGPCRIDAQIAPAIDRVRKVLDA